MVMTFKICQRCGKTLLRRRSMHIEVNSKKQPTGFVSCAETERCNKRRGDTKTLTSGSKFDQRIQSLL